MFTTVPCTLRNKLPNTQLVKDHTRKSWGKNSLDKNCTPVLNCVCSLDIVVSSEERLCTEELYRVVSIAAVTNFCLLREANTSIATLAKYITKISNKIHADNLWHS